MLYVEMLEIENSLILSLLGNEDNAEESKEAAYDWSVV